MSLTILSGYKKSISYKLGALKRAIHYTMTVIHHHLSNLTDHQPQYALNYQLEHCLCISFVLFYSAFWLLAYTNHCYLFTKCRPARQPNGWRGLRISKY